jgi:hypothetical protein
MLAIVGTIPDNDFPLIAGNITMEGEELYLLGRSIPVNRGTPALLAAAISTANKLNQPPPFVYLAGDVGTGYGSRQLYEYITSNIGQSDADAITFHYLQPEVDWHNRVMFALDELSKHPVLIADAGYMYAAKMSGQAAAYDLFTPDVGELAFLADEKAPHPFYTRGFILQEENRVPDLIKRAYKHNNAAQYLLVKGKQDYLADKRGILEIIDNPIDDSMEAIGGTGDTLTGIASALIGAGVEISDSAIIAAKVNRIAGFYAKPTPATQVIEIIRQIPRALEETLNKISRFAPPLCDKSFKRQVLDSFFKRAK